MKPYQNPGSIFEQIADSLELSILKGQPPEGTRVLSVREAASELEVNVNTVVRAYGLLEERKIIEKERGLGYFVSTQAVQRIIKRRREVFFTRQIPLLARDMETLGISFSDLKERIEAAQP